MPEATLKKPTDKATKPFWEVVRTAIDNHSFMAIFKRSERMAAAATREVYASLPVVKNALDAFENSEAVVKMKKTRQQLADTEAHLAQVSPQLSRAETRLQAAIGKGDLDDVDMLRRERDAVQLDITDSEQLRQTLKDSLVAQYDRLEFELLQLWRTSNTDFINGLRQQKEELQEKITTLIATVLDDLYKIHAVIGGAGQGIRMGDSQLAEVLGPRPPREPHHGQPIVMRDGHGNRMAG